MNCLAARQTLELAFSDEPAAGTLDARQHVSVCPTCQAAIRRHEQFDRDFGALCRDVPVPADLKNRLLAGLDAGERRPSPFPAAPANELSPGETVVMTSPVGRSSVGPRRRRMGAVALAAACVLAIGLGAWSLWPNPPSISLDETAGLVAATAEIDPANLPPLTKFARGLVPQPPATMDARPLVSSPRRLGNQEVAVYFFKLVGPRRTILQGRLVVIPKRLVAVNELPAAVTFATAPTAYKTGFCMKAWVEGDLVYVCLLSGGENELHQLAPQRPQPA